MTKYVLKGLQIFIASPSGLEAERKVFSEEITEYNTAEANARGVHFIPVGWDIALGGVKRPQSEINKLVEKCDYFILVVCQSLNDG